MRSECRPQRGRMSRSCWAVLVVVGAVAGLGADRPEAWRDAGASLPPVTLAPDALVTPLPPLPLPPDAGQVVLVAKQDPAVPDVPPAPVTTIPLPLPAKPEPRPSAAPAVPSTPAATAPAPLPNIPAPAPVADAPALVGAPSARVYVINGMSVFGPSGFSAMVDRIRGAGYPDTRSGPWYLAYRFERDIRQLHREQPGTPVAVIGYSFGVYRARAIANRLDRDGIPVAMVGYVGGDYLQNLPSSMPGGARVVNVTGNGFLLSGRNLLFRGTDLTGADNTRLDVRHLNLPRQTETVDSLLNGLAAAASVPPYNGVLAASPPVETVSSSPAALAGTPSQPQGAYSRLLPMLGGSGRR
jgi:hypothetical protein